MSALDNELARDLAVRMANRAGEILEYLRAAGWAVAVHNDYRLHGNPHTFWLLTHPCGSWIKGEGATDYDALTECRNEAATIILDRELLGLLVARELHANVPEDKRPMSRSDFSDAQWERIQAAIDVVLGRRQQQ